MQANLARPLRLGTRGSLLARTQSRWVGDELMRRFPGVAVELVVVKTTGDKIQDRQLHDLGGKGLFTKELEQSLLDGQIDFAVHSYKDVPVTMPLVDETDLVTAATPAREDARDVLVAGGLTLQTLPAGATVGTGSLRRQASILALRGDVRVVPIRGNIDTRLGKQREGALDAVVLAAAGLVRAGLLDAATMRAVAITEMVPAAGQGALAVQCRRGDFELIQLLAALNDPVTADFVAAERAVIRGLNADCHSPIGVHCFMDGDRVALTASVPVGPGGTPLHRATVRGGRGSEPDLAAGLTKMLLRDVGGFSA